MMATKGKFVTMECGVLVMYRVPVFVIMVKWDNGTVAVAKCKTAVLALLKGVVVP